MSTFPLSTLDIIALLVFLTGMFGYNMLVDRIDHIHRRSVIAAMNKWRERWMLRMTERDTRIFDASIIGNIMRSVQFFATTTMFVLAGLVAMLGAGDRALGVVAALPFTAPTNPGRYEMQISLLIFVFIYAFFKFTWGLRQFNYASTVIGAVAHANTEEEKEEDAMVAARVANRGAYHFNSGIRSYYFGLAALGWFIHPLALIMTSLWVVVVLYRREFRSAVLSALGHDVRNPLTGR